RYGTAIRAAIHAAPALAGDMSLDDLDRSLRDLDVRVVEPLQARVAGGKSTVPVLAAAHRLGMPFIHLGAGVYQLGWGSRARRLDRGSTGGDSAIGARLAQHKTLCAELLRMAGLPAPEHVVAVDEGEALQAAAKLGWPVVVKPTDRDRGEGVTVD